MKATNFCLHMLYLTFIISLHLKASTEKLVRSEPTLSKYLTLGQTQGITVETAASANIPGLLLGTSQGNTGPIVCQTVCLQGEQQA